jgi:N-acetylmuramoyl-L-alanine amidase
MLVAAWTCQAAPVKVKAQTQPKAQAQGRTKVQAQPPAQPKVLVQPPASALPPAQVRDKSVTKSYNLAQARYHGLEFSPTLARDRENWLLCAKAFARAYVLDPYHPSAPNILLNQGDLYLRIYKQFGNKEDINEALSFYDDVVTLSPQHSLADDALYRAATVQARELKDVKTATLLLAKLVAVYPKGDMAAAAEADLTRLRTTVAQAEVAPPAEKPVAKDESTIEPAPAAGLATSKASRPIEVVSLRHWSTESYTRVVIETTGPVPYEGHLLKKSEADQKRLYVDLKKCFIARDKQQPIPIKDGLLQQMRSAQFDRETVRVVLDTLAIADYKIFNLDDPFRIIVDVRGSACTPANVTEVAQPQVTQPRVARPSQPTRPRVARAKAPAPPVKVRPAATPVPPLCKNPSLAQQLGLGIKRVVLDPGHGGKDPGAIGIGGLREKDIVLNVAKKVARKIATRMGIEVVLTRKSDIFIPLEERTAIANTKGGDLFISIHANAAPSAQAQGIETYYLDLAGTEAERGLAAVENASSTRQISDLQNILSSLMQNSKKDESARLAGTIQDRLVAGLGRQYPQIQDHGVKTAPFIVLIGAQMPSILTEIAFISNPLEAQRLQNDQYLEDLADHITDGVASYSSSLSMARL